MELRLPGLCGVPRAGCLAGSQPETLHSEALELGRWLRLAVGWSLPEECAESSPEGGGLSCFLVVTQMSGACGLGRLSQAPVSESGNLMAFCRPEWRLESVAMVTVGCSSLLCGEM